MVKKLAQAIRKLTLGEKIVLAAALAAGAGVGGYGGSKAGRGWAERNPPPLPAEIVNFEREATELDREMERTGVITYERAKDGSLIVTEKPDKASPELAERLNKFLRRSWEIDPAYKKYERAIITRGRRAKRTGAGLGALGGGLLSTTLGGSMVALRRGLREATEETPEDRRRRERQERRERLGLGKRGGYRRKERGGYGDKGEKRGGVSKKRHDFGGGGKRGRK